MRDRRPVFRMGVKPIKQFKAMIGVDVSGSISKEDVEEALGQLKFLFARVDAEIEYVTFDTEITEKRILKSIEDVVEIEAIYGRGGTSFQDILKYAEEQEVHELIIFTDGYGDQQSLKFPPRDMRVWWITTDVMKFPFGEVFKLER